MNCTNCGTPLNDNAKFCTKCGAVIQPVTENMTQPLPTNGEGNPNQSIYTTQYMTMSPKKGLSTKQHNAIHTLMGITIIILGILTIYYANEATFWYDSSSMYKEEANEWKHTYENYQNRSDSEKTMDAIRSWFD